MVIEELPADVEALRLMVLALHVELADERVRHQRKVAEFETLIEAWSVKYQKLTRLAFGRRSERLHEVDRKQLGLFNEAEHDAPKAQVCELKPARQPPGRQGGGRRRPAREVQRIERLHDIPESERACPCCGKPRPKIGEDRSEEIEIIPAKAVVVVHVRPKYGPCTCDAFDEEEDHAVIQERAPAKIAPGSLFSNRTIAHILTAKFGDGVPFHRQEKVIVRMGVDIERSVMARLAIRTADRLKPLLDRMRADIRGSPVVRMDETPIQVLKEEGRSPSTESRMWVATGYCETGEIVLFQYDRSRAGSVAEGILGDSWQGYLQTDGYSGYTALGMRKGVEHVGCWAHIRRHFYELYLALGKPDHLKEILNLIKKLYEIERDLRDRGERGDIDIPWFLAEREAKTLPVFTAISDWLVAQRAEVAPQGPLGKALSYAMGQYDRATRYVEHPLLTPDNNSTERAIRPFVIGRKNWMFADTPDGAAASAALYSLIETAKANEHEPYRYLCYLFDTLPKVQGDEALAALLPYRIDPKAY